MSAKLDLGQIANVEDIMYYLDECIKDDGLTPEELIPWFEDVTSYIKEANIEFQRKYGEY